MGNEVEGMRLGVLYGGTFRSLDKKIITFWVLVEAGVGDGDRWVRETAAWSRVSEGGDLTPCLFSELPHLNWK